MEVHLNDSLKQLFVNLQFEQNLPGKPIYLVYMTCKSVFGDSDFRFADSVLFATFDRSLALEYIQEHQNVSVLVTYIKDFNHD